MRTSNCMYTRSTQSHSRTDHKFFDWLTMINLKTSTEVLRRSPQWGFNKHTYTHTHTHTQRERERERDRERERG